jgi:hypothetical protein
MNAGLFAMSDDVVEPATAASTGSHGNATTEEQQASRFARSAPTRSFWRNREDDMVLRESERFDEGIGGGGGGGAQRQHEAIEEEEDIDLDSEDPSNSHEMHEIASLSDPIVESGAGGHKPSSSA